MNRGRFSLYTEMSAEDGKFKGYVKPIIKDLKVLGPQNRNDTFFQRIWEYVVAGAGVVFRNQKEDQLATKIRIEGSYKNPQTNIYDAI